jgi:hypothetical protein
VPSQATNADLGEFFRNLPELFSCSCGAGDFLQGDFFLTKKVTIS